MTSKSIFPCLLFLSLLCCVPCRAQYQLLNPGFESWEGTSATSRPSHWSSFPQADGSWAWAASTAQHYHRNGGRPGTSGSSYLTIYSRSVLGVVANGNMTTGQIHAGSTSASSSSNYNYTHRGSAYCHPFSGTPDSMYVWVSYYASNASSQGSIRAYLHGDSDFRDPNDSTTASLYRGKAVARFTRTTSSSSAPTWVQQCVPFVYDGTSSVNYVLMSMTTNTTAGGGSANDSLSVDDIQFVYSAWLDSLLLNGTPIADFRRDSFDYAFVLTGVDALQNASVAYFTQSADAAVVIDTLVPDALTRQFVLHVLAEDSVTNRTYTVTLSCPPPPCDTVTGIAATVEGNSVIVTWTAGANNQQWEVEYGLQGFPLGQGTDTICEFSTFLLNGLDYNSNYDLYVRALCGETVYSDWSHAITISIGEEPLTECLPVDSVAFSSTSFTSGQLFVYSYYSVEGTDSVGYLLQLEQNGYMVLDTVVNDSIVTLDNLQEGTQYLLHIRTLCDSVNQSSVALFTFTTLSDTTAIFALQDTKAAFNLYPNPAQGQVRCVITEGDYNGGVLTLFDAAGRTVMRQPVATAIQTIDISSLPAGHYTAYLQTVRGCAMQRLTVVR